MGQATVDLPDPLQSPAAPATAGTDDLLAQLAGDEIERLLAETETERPAAPSAASAPAAPVAGASPTQAPAPSAVVTADDVTSMLGDPKEQLATELDALFQSLDTAASASPPSPASPPPPPAAIPAVAAPSATPAPPPEKSADSATSTAELKALGEPIPIAESAAVAVGAADAAAAAALEATLVATSSADARDDARPSLIIRLLELINSPLGNCSDSVRQTVGKIAIATLLNAIAVLVYTLVFRHR